MDTVALQIDDVAFGGSGVARHAGKVVFVPFTIDGERASARIVREKKQFAEAEVVEVLQPSGHRTEPQCPYFGRCGGCAYQHITYEHQLILKARQVEQVLRRIGKLRHIPTRPIVPSPLEYSYRNRITVHAQDGIIGFFRRDAHKLIDITHCPISRAEVNEALAELRHRKPHDGHYTLRAPGAARVFEQTNDAVAEALRELIASFFPDRGPLLIDAFCGSGFFAKRLVANFGRVIGIEWDRYAVEAARGNAAPNEIYINGNVEIELPAILQNEQNDTCAMIVDPPATGLSASFRNTLLQFAPAILVYVSCNPSTLARDLGELKSQFAILSVTPLDMFPQTAEIEVAVHLQRSAAIREGAAAPLEAQLRRPARADEGLHEQSDRNCVKLTI